MGKYVRLKTKKVVVIVTFIIEYDSGPYISNFWICQSSDYGRVLNIKALHSVLNMPVYALAEFWMYLGRFLNMPGFWIYKSYTGFNSHTGF